MEDDPRMVEMPPEVRVGVKVNVRWLAGEEARILLDDGEGFCVGTFSSHLPEDNHGFDGPEQRRSLFSPPVPSSNGTEDDRDLVPLDAPHGYGEEVDDTFHNLHQAQLDLRGRPAITAGS